MDLRIDRILFAIFAITFAQSPLTAQQITVKAQIANCADPLHLYEFNGFGFEEVAQAQAQGDKEFVFELPQTDHRFYYVGQKPQATKPLILGKESDVKLEGSCANIREVEALNSPINQQYAAISERMGAFGQKLGRQLRAYQQAETDSARQAVKSEMAELDRRKQALLDSLQEANDYLAGIVALNTYLSYPNNQGDYTNEVSYFANEFFRYVDFSREAYNYIPWIYQAFQSYSQTITRVGLSSTQQRLYLERMLERTPDSSRTRQLAYGGVLSTLRRSQNDNTAYFGKQFAEEYKTIAPEAAKRIATQVASMANLGVGGEAPEFTQETPAGEALSLSDLRGKVVLLDFWASWCGPCRRENPNVVRVYNKYKDQGFEILGISLDQNRDRWLQAIEADGLEWRHVSDLNGWQNAVAQQYKVRSIPQTYLLDEEGNIIAKNLRGQALENKLAELFEGEGM